jgi:hypothetical protein
MARLAGRVAAVVVMVVGFQLGASGPPATAVDKNGVCDDGDVCLWRDGNLRGCLYDSDANNDDDNTNFTNVRYNTCPKISLNDSVTSYFNNRDTWLELYEHALYQGFHYCVAPRARGNVVAGFDNKASSYTRRPVNMMDEQRCNHVDRD